MRFWNSAKQQSGHHAGVPVTQLPQLPHFLSTTAATAGRTNFAPKNLLFAHSNTDDMCVLTLIGGGISVYFAGGGLLQEEGRGVGHQGEPGVEARRGRHPHRPQVRTPPAAEAQNLLASEAAARASLGQWPLSLKTPLLACRNMLILAAYIVVLQPSAGMARLGQQSSAWPSALTCLGTMWGRWKSLR